MVVILRGSMCVRNAMLRDVIECILELENLIYLSCVGRQDGEDFVQDQF